MKVKFHEIPPEGLEVIARDFAWFPDDEVKRIGELRAKASLSSREHRIHVEGYLSGTVAYDCDRCLEEFTAPLESHFELLVECGGQELLSREHECSGEDLDIMLVPEPVVDVFVLFRQQVYLAQPQKRLCSERCKGLCCKCGKNRNVEKCNCPQLNESSAFQGLAKLKNSSC